MDLSKEVWHCELYRLQQQSPKPFIVKCNRALEIKPVQYGDEYHGNIDRGETDNILSKYNNGAFLIRDSQRNVGSFTLVIRFDECNKNYVLYYNSVTKEHYVGNKYFSNILDLVQDGLIHMFIETRGASILQQIAEAHEYETTPFYRTKMIAMNQELKQQQHQVSSIPGLLPPPQPQLPPLQQLVSSSSVVTSSSSSSSYTMPDYNGSCDSGIFNSLKSNDSSNILSGSGGGNDSMPHSTTSSHILPIHCSTLSSNSSSDLSPQIHHKTSDALLLCHDRMNKESEESPPVAPPRRKSLYASLRHAYSSSNTKIRPPLPTEMNNNNMRYSQTEYEPIFPATGLHKQHSQKSTGGSKRCSVISNTSTTTVTKTTSTNHNISQLEKPHNFRQHTFMGPQWCDLCAHFMWGLVAQGTQCDDCGLQAHKKCAQKAAADCCPVMKKLRRVFAVELTGLAKMENRAIPLVLVKLISALERRDLKNCHGIYRISGNLELIEEVKTILDKDVESIDLDHDGRVKESETLTGLIKLFLRQLPIPLITAELYPKLMELLKKESKENIMLIKMRELILQILNSVHYATLKFLIQHLQKVSQFHNNHQMDSSNLAIIFAPTLICKTGIAPSFTSDAFKSPEDMMLMQMDYKNDCLLIQTLIENCDIIFCDDDDDDDDDVINDETSEKG